MTGVAHTFTLHNIQYFMKIVTLRFMSARSHDAAVAAHFVERMGGALTDAGLPRLPSRVFAALVVDDDGRMTAAELAETLAVSPAAVSGAVNFLGPDRVLAPRARTRVAQGRLRRRRRRVARRDDAQGPDLRADDDGPRHRTRRLGRGRSPAHRLWLMREFLAFVDDEMDGLAATVAGPAPRARGRHARHYAAPR